MERTTKLTDANERLLLLSLSKYYHGTAAAIDTVLPIIEGRGAVSLRLIDYFLTNYLKHHAVVIERVVDGQRTQFPVYLSYQSQLTAYSKHAFDCFRRGKRILFGYGNNKSIETTIGQLNLFRWLLSNGVLEYVTQNMELIKEDMNRSDQTKGLKEGTEDHPAHQDADGAAADDDAPTKPAQQQQQQRHMKRYVGATTVSFS